MQKAPIPDNEAARLETLRALNVLDTDAEERFDRITRLAQRLFRVPIALVSLIDTNRQWFKSCQGLSVSETPRDVSFCGHAIHGDEVFVISDAASDPRFSDNPLVEGDPHIRFYAGVPLGLSNGHKIGTLCIIDRRPRRLGEEDLDSLRDLATMVEQELSAVAMATTDALTGLSNCRGFEMLARHTLAVANRNGKPATLLFIDLDGFEEINDTHGHAKGDRTLVGMAAILLETFRQSDVVARLGGDEFAVLLSEIAECEAAVPLARLTEHVRRWNQTPGEPCRLAYSVGVASLDPNRPASIGDLLADADDRMYAQKRERGRRGARSDAAA